MSDVKLCNVKNYYIEWIDMWITRRDQQYIEWLKKVDEDVRKCERAKADRAGRDKVLPVND